MSEDEVLAKLLEGRGRPAGERPPAPSAEAEELLEVADLMWSLGHGAPPLESDPVAAMLGLVADPRFTLDQVGLKRARQYARVKASELATRLAARGWEVRASDVVRWENQSSADVSPALIKAIAEVLDAKIDRLTTTLVNADDDRIGAITRSPKFERLVERWAAVRGVPKAFAATTLKSRMLATVHRGDLPDAGQLLRALDALVTAVESDAR